VLITIQRKVFQLQYPMCTCPNWGKNEEEKDNFFDDSVKTYEKCPGRDVKIITGDLNVKINKEDIYRPRIGIYSGHTKSYDNGIRLINFASSQNMLTVSTCLITDIHKMTWKSPGGNTFNQTDHLVIDTRHPSNLLAIHCGLMLSHAWHPVI
jgi:hypothetical protein